MTHITRKNKLLVKLLTKHIGEPPQTITFDYDTLRPPPPIHRRWGRPRYKWYKYTLENYWDQIGLQFDTRAAEYELDISFDTHKNLIKTAAQQGYIKPIPPGPHRSEWRPPEASPRWDF